MPVNSITTAVTMTPATEAFGCSAVRFNPIWEVQHGVTTIVLLVWLAVADGC
ncbi:hypothetical protein ZHAS_00011445 [Anopheles sinensis]|uniref:Uncharacterized protein n=1 Tax=Anopheles sinensis TaxID=74873 RepID=A0A084W0G9_ANOSI|nr:hypothetical protein ZHAS_00011445 [Anopheles sinensis]